MFVIQHKKIFTLVSALLVLLSLVAIALFGLRPGIEFTGGTIVEVSYPNGRPEVEEVNELLQPIAPGTIAQPTGDDGYIIRTRFLEDNERSQLTNLLSVEGTHEVVSERVSSIGPTIGAELRIKALYAIIGIVITTILFIAFTFRKVSEPVSSWVYGAVAIITLLHDIIIPTGFFALFGYLYGWEVDVLFITALLAILGLSINDTIVVFDRIRENLNVNKTLRDENPQQVTESFGETVGRSLSETYARSINTSLAQVFVLISVLILGSESTRHFAFILFVGMLVGTYSSVFLASPLLVFIEEHKKRSR